MSKINMNTLPYWAIDFDTSGNARWRRARLGEPSKVVAKERYIRDYKVGIRADLTEINNILDNVGLMRKRLASLETMETDETVEPEGATPQ